MAKSPSEQIRDLTVQVGILTERTTGRERETEDLRQALQREIETRRTVEKERREVDAELQRELASLQKENALLKQQFQDHIKQVELWDNRRWGLIMLLIGTVFSLASGLIVTLAKK